MEPPPLSPLFNHHTPPNRPPSSSYHHNTISQPLEQLFSRMTLLSDYNLSNNLSTQESNSMRTYLSTRNHELPILCSRSPSYPSDSNVSCPAFGSGSSSASFMRDYAPIRHHELPSNLSGSSSYSNLSGSAFVSGYASSSYTRDYLDLPHFSGSTSYTPNLDLSGLGFVSGLESGYASPFFTDDYSAMHDLELSRRLNELHNLHYYNSDHHNDKFVKLNYNHNHDRRMLYVRNPSHTTNNVRIRVNISFPWDEIKGKIASYACDKSLSKWLIKKFELGHMEGLKMVVSEIKDDIFQILFDQTGSQFFQKLLDFLDHHYITELLEGVTANQRAFVEICRDRQGTRAMQKLLKFLDKNNMEEKVLILNAIRGVVLNLSKNMNGYHVIEQLLETFRGVYEVIGPLLDEIANHSVDLAKNRFGCCVLQHCLKAQGPVRDHILHQIIAHAFDLSENEFGNFVVQSIMDLQDPYATSELIKRLEGNFVNLTKNKYGSNVIQKCLEVADGEHTNLIVNEVVDFTIFLEICQHPYGNYVVQTLYDVTKGIRGEASRLQHQKIVDFIYEHYPFLRSDMYGKRVLSHINSSKFLAFK